MKEEDLTKAIQIKEQLDYERELLNFANHKSVDLRVNLVERCYQGNIHCINDILGDNVIKELKAKVIANIEKSINELLEELEKL